MLLRKKYTFYLQRVAITTPFRLLMKLIKKYSIFIDKLRGNGILFSLSQLKTTITVQ